MKSKKILIPITILLVLFITCWVFVADYYRADDAAVSAMASVPGISVEQLGDSIAFIPEETETGFIFYPGGKVEYTAYAPLMRILAENGVLCVLCDMPLNLAFLGINAADGIPERYPQITNWYIGGHSLGGSMAANYAAKHPDDFRGLVLLASYSTDDLSKTGLKVVSIIGSEDGVLNMENYEDNKDNLPEDFAEYIIEGGCHAGFGSYGAQDGDGIPAISAEEQTIRTAGLLTESFGLPLE